MLRLAGRVERLEAKAPGGHRKVHAVVQDVGMTEADAIDAYGREKIGDDDLIIVRLIVDPVAREEQHAA